MDEQLLADLKSRLNITWNDTDTDLIKMIDGAKTYLSEVTGASFDFSKEKGPTELLLERCRYVYNNAADEFETNFQHELSRLILHVALGKVGVVNGSETVPGDV
jgi:hypothetical protein